MTTDVELLPLPEGEAIGWTQAWSYDQMRSYARANVSRATARLQAEVEALRAEVAEWKRVAEARADKLAKDAARYRCLSAMATQQADSLGPIFRIDVRRSESCLFDFDAAVDAILRESDAQGEVKETDLWRCTVCGRVGTVGRCCGEETRERASMEQLLADAASATSEPKAEKPTADEVLIAVKRSEGYEDVHPELVAEDFVSNPSAWCYRVLTGEQR